MLLRTRHVVITNCEIKGCVVGTDFSGTMLISKFCEIRSANSRHGMTEHTQLGNVISYYRIFCKQHVEGTHTVSTTSVIYPLHPALL